ncbi:MAG: response regulator transcription factor [Aggregatilineales bacterium]
MVRVLLVEDHNLVRQGTRMYLESRGVDIIGEATNGRDAVQMARELQPDVIVMDIHLPELTGVEATRRIRHDNDAVRVLVLTAYNDPAYVNALLEAGADGYILKTAELSELYNALLEVAAGHSAFDSLLLQKATQQRADLPAQIEGLTDREIEVLAQAGHGLTNKEIGKRLFISDRTVQGHLKNIYEKLGVTTRTEAVALALKHGIITLDDAPR